MDFVPEFRFVGLLNDDTTPVGAVHVGLVYEADAAGRPVAIRETDKLSGAFATTAEVAAVSDGWRPGAGSRSNALDGRVTRSYDDRADGAILDAVTCDHRRLAPVRPVLARTLVAAGRPRVRPRGHRARRAAARSSC